MRKNGYNGRDFIKTCFGIKDQIKNMKGEIKIPHTQRLVIRTDIIIY